MDVDIVHKEECDRKNQCPEFIDSKRLESSNPLDYFCSNSIFLNSLLFIQRIKYLFHNIYRCVWLCGKWYVSIFK